MSLEAGAGATAAAPARPEAQEALRLKADSRVVGFGGAVRLTWERAAGAEDSLYLVDNCSRTLACRRVGDRNGQSGMFRHVAHRTTFTLTQENPLTPAGESKGRTESKAAPAAQVTVAAQGLDYLAGDFGGRGDLDGPMEERLSFRHGRLRRPMGLAQGPDKQLFISDMASHTIRWIDNAGILRTLAGDALGGPGLVDDFGPMARFNRPQGIAVDRNSGVVYVADTGNHAIRQVLASRKVETLAGAADPGGDDGYGRGARFNHPTAVALNLAGTALYVADSGNGVIRRIALDADRRVTTLPQGHLASPAGIVVGRDSKGEEHLFVSDDQLHVIFAIPTARPEQPRLLAGTPSGPGFKPGPGAEARFDCPRALALTGLGDLLVADTGNHALRLVRTADAGDGKAGTVADLFGGESKRNAGLPRTPGMVLELEAGRYLAADPEQGLVWGIRDGKAQAYAGSLPAPAAMEDGRDFQARFDRPLGILATARGRILVADTGNGRIREIRSNGEVASWKLADGVAAIRPGFLADNGEDGVFFTDAAAGCVGQAWADGRVARVAGRIRAEAKGPGQVVDGDALAAAEFSHPLGIARGDDGTLYVADRNCIRKIHQGKVETLAGDPDRADHLDQVGGAARFHKPIGLAWHDGNLYVADSGNHAIRKVSPKGAVSTVAGVPAQAAGLGAADDPHRLNRPFALAFSLDGVLYVTEAGRPGLRRVCPVDRTIGALVPGTADATTSGPLLGTDAGVEARWDACLGWSYGIACTAHGDLLVVTRPEQGASGGVVQITAPEEKVRL